jgi:two-component system phosphate regulon sensor histidine kinase PhoR
MTATTQRTFRRLAGPLILGVVLGVGAAALLGRVLDEAVRERTRQDLAAMLERLEMDFGHDFPLGPTAHERVRLAAKQSGARVTLIDAKGAVLSDSQVDAVKLPTLENHLSRPEVMAARANRTGFAERRSASVVEPLLYVARRVGPPDDPLGYIRIAVPESKLDADEAPFRTALTRISLAAGLLLALLVFLIRRRHAVELDRIREGIAGAADGRRPDTFPSDTEEGQDVFVALTRFADLVKAQKEGSETARVLARTVFDEVPAGLVVVDRSLAVLDANAAALRLFDVPSVPPQGALVDLVRDSAALSLFKAGTSRLQAEPPGTCVIRVGRSGVERTLELAVRPVAHGDRPGEPAAVGVVRDVTERERTDELRRRFVADVSHELRTPIASIRAAVETLAGAGEFPRELSRFLEILQRQSAEMEALVSDLTDLSQIESGTVTLRMGPEALAPLLLDVTRGLESAAKDRDVEVAVDAPRGLVVRGDARRLSQIFRNLVDNAIKYSPPSSRVDVRAERDGTGHVLVHVADRGIGISLADQERIFQRFFRVDPSRSKTTPGTGLGLAIVKHLLVLHEGAIRVDSEPGNGSTFTVILPETSAADLTVTQEVQ